MNKNRRLDIERQGSHALELTRTSRTSTLEEIASPITNAIAKTVRRILALALMTMKIATHTKIVRMETIAELP